MPKIALAGMLIAFCLIPRIAVGTDYIIDKEGQHAFVTFKASHLGFSYIIGHFESFEGSFSHDPDNPGNSSARVTIEARSLDTNHAERDKHLRGADFLDVNKYPTITFESVAFSGGANAGKLTGNLSLHGVTKPVVLDVTQIGEGAPRIRGGGRLDQAGKSWIRSRMATTRLPGRPSGKRGAGRSPPRYRRWCSRCTA